jgi:transposase
MAYNFLRGDRDQPFLLPPDLRDWLPEGHLAWFVIDVVNQLDLQPFYRAHRDDGHGHPAYDPETLLGVLLYAYAIGVRSSRQIERRCHEDVAFRVLAANQLPDHVTIARFRVRHQQALDGTKLAGNAAATANRTLDKLQREVAEILRQAAEADQQEDGLFGDGRGDELPDALASKAGRLARLWQAKARLEAEATERQQRYAQQVAASAAAAAAKGRPPRRLKPRPRGEAPNPEATGPTAPLTTGPDRLCQDPSRYPPRTLIAGGPITGVRSMALERPAMTYVREQLRQRLARQVSRAYLRWRHPTSGRPPGDRFL